MITTIILEPGENFKAVPEPQGWVGGQRGPGHLITKSHSAVGGVKFRASGIHTHPS